MKLYPGAKLRKDTESLAMPRGRRVGQPGHRIARDYLTTRMEEIGLYPFSGDSYSLPYKGTSTMGEGLDFMNIAGVVRGSDPVNRKPILIGAHYDSVIDAPCADDNATAVAAVLAAAEVAQRKPPRANLIVVLFDSEEPPWFMSPDMGSNRFVTEHCSGIDFAGAIILDLIGHDVVSSHVKVSRWLPRIRNLLFVLGLESHPSMLATVDGASRRSGGLTIFPTLNRYVPDMSDHHAFRVAGQPFLFLTCAQGKHYHQPGDDMAWVNMRKVRRVFRYLSGLIFSLDSLEPAGYEASDSVSFETRTIKRELGWLFPSFLKLIGLEKLQTRGDIDILASTLSGLFMGMSLEVVDELESLE